MFLFYNNVNGLRTFALIVQTKQKKLSLSNVQRGLQGKHHNMLNFGLLLCILFIPSIFTSIVIAEK